jgi:hypothetical protein
MIPTFLARWLRKPVITPAQAAQVLSRRAHDKRRAKIRATAREMRQRLGMPAHPLLED